MAKPRSHAEPLRLPLRGGGQPPSSRRSALARTAPWAIAAIVALAFALLPIAIGLRAGLVALVAFAMIVRARRLRGMERARAPNGWILADARGLARVDPVGTKMLADWGARFGVTVLANE